VELGQQDDGHHEQCHAEGPGQEGLGLRLVLILAAEQHVDAVSRRIGRQPGLQFLYLVVYQQSVRNISGNLHHAHAIGTLKAAHTLCGLPGNEVADRNIAHRRANGQAVELVEVAHVFREAHANVHLVVGVIGTVVTQQDAVGQQLDGAADGADVSPEARGVLAVYPDLPVDTRQGTAVCDVHEATNLLHPLANMLHRKRQQRVVDGRQFNLHRFAGGRAILLHLRLYHDAGEVSGALAHLIKYLCSRTPQLPVHQLQLDATDDVLGAVVAHAQATACVDGLEFLHVEDARLNFAHQGITLGHRQVATCMDGQLGHFRLDGGEELHALAETAVQHGRQDQQRNGSQ